jgi:hypothetical protein
MKSNYTIYRVLKLMVENNQSNKEANQLIEYTICCAYCYLKYRYKSISHLLMAEDVTIKELAIDAIAPLFQRNEQGYFIKIIKSFNNWEPTIETEEGAMFFMNKLAAKCAEKYISELLRQSDPLFSKIIDSIIYLIEKHHYKKKQLFGTTYIIQNDDVNIGNLPDADFIYSLPQDLFYNKNSMLLRIFDYILENSNKAAAIPLNVLVLRIKSIGSIEYNIGYNTPDNYTEVESMIDLAFVKVIYKLKEIYLNKNKINNDDFIFIKKALECITADMKNGGVNPGLHNYLLSQYPNLSYKEYHAKYQNVFEYLYKLMRQDIASQIIN